ncbi:MAG: glycoside hydrolase family 57 protein [Candidatus Kapabacteria bacterium]|nr:glycoside hydrolase family 57 protein [Candidatus Kapabacteria bacterium]
MTNTLPLRICFLWHQHQPDYRIDDEFFLPWVRLHATKDYRDLCDILGSYSVKHTFNLVPSMLMQLDEYGKGRQDELERMCRIPAHELSQENKVSLARWAVTIQRDTMVRPLPRYDELFEMLANAEVDCLDEQAWRDVQVLVNLAWVGPVTRRNSVLATELLLQGCNFNEEQKHALLDLHHEIMSDIVPTFLRYEKKGAFEISVTPFHHPILPLVIDTDVAHESMPFTDLPLPAYKAPYHAERHVRNAREDWKRRSGHFPTGMWLAEGSVSTEALEILAKNNVSWTATDEDVLKRSLGEQWLETEKFFPHIVETPHGSVSVLFRDHGLSDAIGFEYARWDPQRAAEDFARRLEERRHLIVSHLGEQALADAVVPIILDGENCWEFYDNNGEDFLHALMEVCGDTSRYLSLTCSEASVSGAQRRLHSLKAGSWINGTFDIWIGSPLKNLAWSLLVAAKSALEGAGRSAEEVSEALETVEASDWFWWYDDRHVAEHKSRFDAIFRRHLAKIFSSCGVAPPVDLSCPLLEVVMTSDPIRVPVVFGTTAMHRSRALVRDVSIESHEEWQRITIRLERRPATLEEVVVQIIGQDGFERACLIAHDELLWRSPHHDEGFEWLSENAVALYVHSHRMWTLKIMEERPQDGQVTTVVHLSTP